MNISDSVYDEQRSADKLTRELEKENPDFDASALWNNIPAINNEQRALMVHLKIDDSYPYEPELPLQIDDNDGTITFSYNDRLFLVAHSSRIKARNVTLYFNFNANLWGIKEIF